MSEKQAERIRQTRLKETERVESGRAVAPPGTFSVDVVGLTFVTASGGAGRRLGYPDNLFEVERLTYDAQAMGEPLTCVIIRRPDNAYDPNACEVHVPALGSDGMVGHLPRPVAAKMARLLDAGEVWQGEVAYVRINADHLDRPGLTIRLSRREV